MKRASGTKGGYDDDVKEFVTIYQACILEIAWDIRERIFNEFYRKHSRYILILSRSVLEAPASFGRKVPSTCFLMSISALGSGKIYS